VWFGVQHSGQLVYIRPVSAETANTTVSLPGWARPFAALRHRNYRLFFCGQLVSLTGTWMQSVAQGWLVYTLTNDEFMLGLIAFLGLFPVTVLTMPAGALADHWDKRRVLIVTQCISMTLALILAALAFSDTVQVWHVAVLSALLGLTNAFDIPTRQSFIVELVGRNDLTNAIAMNSTMFNTARIVGPSLGGVLIGAIGVGGCFLLNGLSYIAVIVSYNRMQLPARALPAKPPPVWQAMQAALRFVRGETVVRRILVLVALFSLFVFPFMTLLPVFARDYLKGDAKMFGFLGTAYGLGALIGALTLAWLGQHARQRQLFYAGLIGFCAATALFAASRLPAVSYSAIAVAGWCFIIALSTANSTIQLRAPDTLRGGVMGMYTLAFLGLAPVGSLILGALARWQGAAIAVQVGAGLCALGALAMLRRPRAQTATSS